MSGKWISIGDGCKVWRPGKGNPHRAEILALESELDAIEFCDTNERRINEINARLDALGAPAFSGGR